MGEFAVSWLSPGPVGVASIAWYIGLPGGILYIGRRRVIRMEIDECVLADLLSLVGWGVSLRTSNLDRSG